ncbi:MAG: hypothetical protein Q9160_001564 [Pyrenula sp. 1 TL-2023]
MDLTAQIGLLSSGRTALEGKVEGLAKKLGKFEQKLGQFEQKVAKLEVATKALKDEVKGLDGFKRCYEKVQDEQLEERLQYEKNVSGRLMSRPQS